MTSLYESNAAESDIDIWSLFLNAPAIICILKGPTHIYELANDKYKQLVGNRDIIGKAVRDVFPELEGQGFFKILDGVYKTGKSYIGNEVPVYFDRGNGKAENVYLNFIYQASFNSLGFVDGILVHALDVTEQVLLRQSVEESQAKFHNLIETIPQITWTSDINGDVTYFNQQFYDFSGIKKDQQTEFDFIQIVHPDDIFLMDVYQAIIKSGVKGEHEVRIKNINDEYRWHLVRHVPFKNKDGNIEFWVGGATDIQELKLLQEQKEDFISIASHELKTPITTLKLTLDLLDGIKSNPPSEMSIEMITMAKKSLSKVSRLIDELLNFSRINKGDLPLNKSTFCMADLVNDCCHHVRAEGDYILSTEGDIALKVYADADRISQVLVNFVNNAVKYAPKSMNIPINIETVDNMAKVSVSDKGDGIPQHIIPHLFERYYKGDKNGITYSGLGLGLYISSAIIKRHGGDIGVVSDVGNGSTFWFTLPL